MSFIDGTILNVALPAFAAVIFADGNWLYFSTYLGGTFDDAAVTRFGE
jgi:hypothetical protein